MALGDLFRMNDQHVRQTLGAGVSAGSVSYFDPDNTETPITEFVFENSTARDFSIAPAGDDDSELGEIELDAALKIHPKGWFVIDGQTWKFRGRGGRDVNSQTILLVLPRENSRRQNKGR